MGDGRVFAPVVHKLLDDVDLADTRKLSGVTFDVDHTMAIMTVNGNDVEFTTSSGSGDKDLREAFVGSLLGMLAQRQATWGALFNHPRTLIICPDASFKCERASRIGTNGQWSAAAQLKGDQDRRFILDYDQVIWINHCATDITTRGVGPVSAVTWAMPPTLEIGVVRLRQEERTEANIPYQMGYARFSETVPTTPYPPMATKKPDEWTTLLDQLGLKGDKYTLTQQGSPKSAIAIAGESGGTLGYAKMAAVVLERLMRDRTADLTPLLTWKDVADPAMAEEMYKAAMSGQIPYAAADLDAAQRQPTVMPGQFTFDRVIGVMQHVTGGFNPRPESPSSWLSFGGPAFTALSAGKPNPYARLGRSNNNNGSVADALAAREVVEKEVDTDQNPYARMYTGADPDVNSPGSLSPLSLESDSGDDGVF